MTKWSKVPCLRKQCDRQGLNYGPPDLEFEVLTTQPLTPLTPPQVLIDSCIYSLHILSIHIVVSRSQRRFEVIFI